MNLKTRVMLANDRRLFLDGLEAIIELAHDMYVVGQTRDGLDVVPKVLELAPDLLLLDLMMPGLNGLEIARQLHERQLPTKVMVLTEHATDGYVSEALRHGVAGYVLEQTDAATLLDAMRRVCAGERYLSPPLSLERVAEWQAQNRGNTLDLFDTLTTREREVLQLAVEGLTSAAIGARLNIGKRTVETHRANFQRKLCVKSHTELVMLAVKRGLVRVD